MFWGITPCLNLLEELGEIPEETNILLIGSGDARHVLKTLAGRYRRKPTKINFYIMELVPEVIAKQLLLLNIAMQPVDELGLVQKTRIFMEIFGNTLIRYTSAKYLKRQSERFIKMITNLDYLAEIMPFIKLELKYKERDYLENVFKFYVSNDTFDICDCWDRRLRKSLGVRYDTRKGAFDWDLHMRYHSIGGQIIGVQEYQSFRRDGVAFSWIESEVSKPNRSFVTGIVPNGSSFAHYGYLGDMVTGPFVAYGIECKDKEFFSKHNNTNKYRATDVTERNLREIFYEIEFQQEYTHKLTSDLMLGACMMQVSDSKVIDTQNVMSGEITRCQQGCFALDNVTINFLSISTLNMMGHKDKYKDFFNVIYYANPLLKYMLKDVLQHIAAPKCVLIVENKKFVLSNRDKELEEHHKEVAEKIQGLNTYTCPFNFKKDAYFKYIIEK